MSRRRRIATRVFGTLLLLISAAGRAAPAGWTLQLAWSPEYCESELTSKEPQCTEERYFTVAALLPQVDGARAACERDPLTEDEVGRWLAVIPNRAQIRKIWKSVGACSGLGSADYYTQLERASRRVAPPARFSGVTEPQQATRTELKAAFIDSNPGLSEDAIVLQCRGRWLSGVEVCMDADFEFRSCSITDRCRGDELRIRPLRDSRVGREPVYR